MMTETIPNFLSPDIAQIRRSIRDIDDSYNNEWDILAELLQNSVDAIRETDRPSGKVTITVDARHNTIRIVDDGVGIESEELAPLLRPFSTRKGGNERTVGEKGVGLTFAVFACDRFEIRTGTAAKSVTGRIIGAKTWKYDEDDNPLKLDVDFSPEAHVGTDITLHGIDAPELFELTVPQLIFVIRTRTSVGNTQAIYSDGLEVTTTLVHIDRDGNHTDHEIPFRYWLPTEGLAPSDMIDLDVFRTWVGQSDRTDAEKRNKLRNKIIYFQGEKVHGHNRKLNYYACYVPQRRTWNLLSVRNALVLHHYGCAG